MNAKTISAFALVGIISLGLFAGAAVAASPSWNEAASEGGDSLNDLGPHGTCTMDQTRSQNQICSGQGMMNSYGPNNGRGGQLGNGPGYPDCPYYPCENCTK